MSRNSIAAPLALDSKVSIATVYRTVRLLEEKGILERRDFGGGRARYDPADRGHHHHLIDVDTGQVIEFADAESRRWPAPSPQRLGFDLVGQRLELFGRKPAGRAGARPRPAPRARPATRHVTDLTRPRLRGAARRAISACASRSMRDEIDAAQALRYRVFYEEMGAHADAATAAAQRDRDDFDAVADHLLVVDHDRGEGAEAVVGTYRLIRRPGRGEARALLLGRRIRHLAHRSPSTGEVLELGRSCVDAAYRTRGTLQLLWRGIAAYVFRHRIDADVRLRVACRAPTSTRWRRS